MTKRLTVLFILISFFLNSKAQDIHRVACEGNLKRLDSMLQYTDLYVPDERGRSLMHWAVACKQMEIFGYLMDKGLEINSEDRDGYTPLYVAVQFNNEEFLDTLISLQIDNEWTEWYGASLLEKAILNKNLSIVKTLIKSGVDINITNNRGSTPLEIALRIGASEISDWLVLNGADESQVRTFEISGIYMDQPEPGLTPTMFAPNFISTEEREFGSVFNAEGTVFYFGVDINRKPEIRYTMLSDGYWSQPEPLLTHQKYSYNDPFLSPDENRLYFISKRALDGIGEVKDVDIWYIEKTIDGWSEPINAGPNINSDGNEFYISFTDEGTMYFSSNVNAPEERKRNDQDIYYSKYVDGKFQKAISVGDSINTEHYEADVFVAPDESYLIFCSTRPDGLGLGDLYISFKDDQDIWSKPVNMGAPINTEFHELCPFVTKDGKYLIYTSNEDIYWVSAEIIERYKQQY